MSTESPNRTRAIILTFTVVVGLAVAAIPLFATLNSSDPQDPPAASPSFESDATPAPSSTSAVTVNHEVPCPTGEGADPASQLSDEAELTEVRLPCLTTDNTEATTSMAEQLAGKPSVVNVWAWWCNPCRDELPALQELAVNNPQWNVVGVHVDARGQAGLDIFEDLGIDQVASYQDSQNIFGSVTAIPNVIPVTLVYRPDGTRLATMVRVFEDPEEFQQVVEEVLTHA